MKKAKIDHYTDKEALDFHKDKKPGKIEIISSKNMTTKRDLALLSYFLKKLSQSCQVFCLYENLKLLYLCNDQFLFFSFLITISVQLG